MLFIKLFNEIIDSPFHLDRDIFFYTNLTKDCDHYEREHYERYDDRYCRE